MSLKTSSTSRNTNGRLAQLGHCARTTMAVGGALVAVITGISTLNMVSANRGIATLNEIASPFMQYFSRKA